MIVGYGMPHYRFSADAMADFIASFELYFYLVSVCLCLSMVREVALALIS